MLDIFFMYFYVFSMANLLNFAKIMETEYKKISEEDLDFLILLDEKGIFFDDESISDYSHDETEDLKFLP